MVRRSVVLACGAVVAFPISRLSAQGSPVTVGGVVYTQYQYQLADSVDHVNTFDVTRAYLNVIGRFGSDVLTRVTADVHRATDGSLDYRIKYAYVGYTPPNSPLTFKIGAIHTALLDWEEALWDYRMQGTMPLERAGYVSSSDFGAGVDGKWNGDQVNLQLAVVDGEYYSKGPGDQRKDVMGRVSVRLLATDDGSRVGGVRLTGYAQYGKPTGGGTRQRYLGMVSYRSKMLTLVGEVAATKDSATTTPTPEVTGRIISGYGVVHVPNSQVQLIGRYEITDPDRNTAGDRRNRLIAGIAYQLTPNLRALADWDFLAYESAAAAAADLNRSQALFQVQFTF